MWWIFASCVNSGSVQSKDSAVDSAVLDTIDTEDTSSVVDSTTDTGDTRETGDTTDTIDTGDTTEDTSVVEQTIYDAVYVDSDNIWHIQNNRPWDVSTCIARASIYTPVLDCADLDQDMIVDDWENTMLSYLHPVLILDEQEPFLQDSTGHFAQIARVVYAPTNAMRVDIYIVLAWSKDYGRCGLTAHNGDSERIVLRLMLDSNQPDNYIWTLESLYTAAHEGEVTDAGHIWSGTDMAQLTYQTDAATNYPRLSVFPSEGKHATFGSIAACENVSFIPCLDEDCAPDNVSNPADWYLLSDVYNAGEQDFPILNDLTSVGFAGDFAWDGSHFCGGLGGTGCSSPILEKLLNSPF